MISSNPSMTDGETQAQRGVGAIPGFQSKSGTDPDLLQPPPPNFPVFSWDSRDLDREDQTGIEPKEEARVE